MKLVGRRRWIALAVPLVLAIYGGAACVDLAGVAGEDAGAPEGGAAQDAPSSASDAAAPGDDGGITGDGGDGAAACPGCEVLAAQQERPSGIYASGGAVFWTAEGVGNQGAILRWDEDAGVQTLFPKQGDPLSVTGDGTNIFWVNWFDANSVLRGSPTGGGRTVLESGYGGSDVVVVAPDGSFYWSANPFNTAHGIYHAQPDGMSPETIATDDAGTSYYSLTRGPLGVYWVEASSGSPWWIHALGAGVGTDTKLASATALALAADSAYVYFIDGDLGTLARVTADGVQGAPLATGFGRVLGMAMDETYVYVADVDAGKVVAVDKTAPNHPVTVLATGQTSPVRVFVDDTYVYWTDAGSNDKPDGKVMRTRKPK